MGETLVEGPLVDLSFDLSVVAVSGRGASCEESAEGLSYFAFGSEGLGAESDGEVCGGFSLPPRQLAEEGPEF